MKLIQRNHNVINHDDDLEHLFTLENFPIFMGCVDSKKNQDLTADMQWWISKKTGLIQLNPVIPLEILYSNSHNSGVVGKLWSTHHKHFSSFIQKYHVKNALEIGAGHGELCRNYINENENAKWTIIEPNPKIKSSHNVQVVKGLFDSNFEISDNIDAIIHSHVIEHLYEPLETIQNISKKIKDGTLHFFSVPRFDEMLKRKYTNCLNFEHTIFLSEIHIDYILKSCGFKILEKQYFQDDHSIFYATKKINEQIKYEPVPNLYQKHKIMFNSYINFYLELVKQLNKRIQQHNGPVYLFGGHIFSQHLLQFGLDESQIECILDNDPSKQGKRLYGSTLVVHSPKILIGKQNSAIILRVGVYAEEIKNNIHKNINSNVIFWD